MEAKRERTFPTAPPPPASASAISAVLGDDDLLREILLCLGFPTTLVRAALVSKRWLRHASDPAFLRRFRDRHPPALLGFYVRELGARAPQFVPISEAPELATAVRRASAAAEGQFFITDCRGGRLLVTDFNPRQAVLSPLHPARGKVTLPQVPNHVLVWFSLPVKGGGGGDDDDDGAIAVWMLPIGTTTKLQVDLLTSGSGVWAVHRSAVIDLPEPLPRILYTLPPVRGKIYCLTKCGRILVLDMTASKSSLLQLPDRVRTENFTLSCGQDGSMLFLILAEGYVLSIWQLPTTSSEANDWVLVYDRIHVREACNRRDDAMVMAADDNLEFVFLWLRSSAVLMHIHLRSRSEKVYDELKLHDGRFLDINPFMMVWPPVFPVLREEDNLDG